ncbi:hypothetical protein BDA99DRAFT_532397 [Phascolomyces articulosus]|uniref:Uncharacterized protein n=1 Tax=Phascolomyces articulosus TaxID=60185 RepID=A0AAD5K9J9_9FUNG|nr:hypothetical protein BDA99DRAFT_532397 [Phascolomyces articulosus]
MISGSVDSYSEMHMNFLYGSLEYLDVIYIKWALVPKDLAIYYLVVKKYGTVPEKRDYTSAINKFMNELLRTLENQADERNKVFKDSSNNTAPQGIGHVYIDQNRENITSSSDNS